MTVRYNSKRHLMLGTALAGFGVFAATPALADCLPDAPGTTVTCQTTDPDGFQTTTNGVTITGNASSSGNTTVNNSGTLTGNVTLGAGNDTITNTGTMNGTTDMGAGTNVFNASNGAQLPTLLTAAAAGTSTVNLGAGGGTIG